MFSISLSVPPFDDSPHTEAPLVVRMRLQQMAKTTGLVDQF